MSKVLFVYPRFDRHAESHPALRTFVPMNEYLGSPSLGIASVAATTTPGWAVEYRDDRVVDADAPTDADVVALSFFTPAATRALALADRFRGMGKTVVAGGIFPSLMPGVVSAHVDAVVVGEGETVWPELLADVAAGTLQPYYRAPIADLCRVPVPRLDLYFAAERDGFQPDDYPLQLSRGCPMACEACALPASMGKGLRPFPIEHVHAQLAQLARAGKRACLTEDTSWFAGTAGHRRLLDLFDYIAASGGAAEISYVGISMPMILASSHRTLARARAAGVRMFYLVGGFDPVTRGAFTGQDPKALARAEAAIARCHDLDIEPYTSFLIGNDEDDEGTVERMLEFARRTGIQKAEFAIATPYPGTPRWHQLSASGRILTREWRLYNDANVVFRPKHFTPDALQMAYLRLWREFYQDKQGFSQRSVYERTIQF